MGSGSRCSEHRARGVLCIHRDWELGIPRWCLFTFPVLCPCPEARMALAAVGSCGAGLGWFGLDLGALALRPYGMLSLVQ